MTESTVEQQTACIVNTLGMHARPAAEFVKLAGRFKSAIRVEKGEGDAYVTNVVVLVGVGLEFA